MKKIEDKIVANFKAVKDNLYGKFGELWAESDSFERHIQRRINLGHIENKQDYILKTLLCLETSEEYIFAEHSNSWDNICYNKTKDWAVIFNEYGKIMTSYKIDEKNYLGFEKRHLKYGGHITKGKTDEKFRRYFKNIRN